jgi:hypothetical protein
MPVALSDILSANENYLFMHEQVLDFKGTPVAASSLKDKEDEILHLFSPTGFLDDSWFHRTYWLFGSQFQSGWNQWYLQGRVVPAGRLLVHQGDSVLGYGRKQGYFRWSTPLDYHLFRIKKKPQLNKKQGKNAGYATPTDYLDYDWSKEVPLTVTAMALAGHILFIAGPPDLLNEPEAWENIYEEKTQQDARAQLEALRGDRGSALWAVSAETGDKFSECALPSVPIYDGLAAAYGRLYVALANGNVVCLAGR